MRGLIYRLGHWRCAMLRMSNMGAVIFMGWNAGAGTRLDRLRTIVAALTHHRGEMIRMIVNEAGDAVGQTTLDGMLIKGHERIDAELKHRRKLFFSTGGALVRIHCITIDHVAHKITLAVDGFSRESSSQHTA
jgi:hypothetical protein